jgi:hypothetical protein
MGPKGSIPHFCGIFGARIRQYLSFHVILISEMLLGSRAQEYLPSFNFHTRLIFK